MNRKVGIGLIVLSTIFVFLTACGSGDSVSPPPNGIASKLGIYVTPDIEESGGIWPVSYSTALLKAKEGRFSTIWMLAQWKDIEQSENVFDWTLLDMRVNKATEQNFSVGIITLIITTGNDAQGNFVSELTIPDYVDINMSSNSFRDNAIKFYRNLTTRYKGKIKYIAIGNSVNDYFEHYPQQWEGFKAVYPEIVDTIHSIDPNIIVMCDLNYGESFYSDKIKMQKYLDYFGSSNDDALGFIFYFIDPVYYGDFKYFNKERLNEVLNEMDQRTGDKKVYIIETSCFSRNPNTGDDLTIVQSDYVKMLLQTAPQKDFIIGLS